MRTQLVTAAAALLISAAAVSAQTTPQAARDDESVKTAAFDPSLTGTWTSSPEELKLTSYFDKSVWGENATSVRTVELAVKPAGDATMKVTKKVVDAKGRTVPASTWVEEVQLKIGGSSPGVGPRVEHQADVVSAVRLFPDDKDYRWEIDGLRVKVVSFRDGDGSIEVRYDTPEGRGSFWETLRRGGASPKNAKR